jgi:site-specific DNA recombinase
MSESTGFSKLDFSDLPLIPYVRVSRIGGRHGESFISPEEQLNQIRSYADRHGITLTEVFEDLDQSGKNTERPEFQRALDAIEAGEAGGIIVAKLDRFARSVVDAIQTAKWITDAHDATGRNGRFVCVAENIDPGTPGGEFQFHIFAALAQFELARIRESWKVAVGKAVMERGVHVSRHTPFGYTRKSDEPGRGKLVPDPATSEIVKQLFLLRSDGWSWGQLCEWLDEQAVRPPSAENADDFVWTRGTVRGIIENPVYKGHAHARAGKHSDTRKIDQRHRLDFTNEKAHEPIVTVAEWEAAQTTDGGGHGRDGTVSSRTLGRSILSCETCGHTLLVTGRTNRKTGEREPFYYCRRRFSDGICSTGNSIDAKKLDPFLEEQFVEGLRRRGDVRYERVQAEGDDLDTLAATLDEARDDYADAIALGRSERKRMGEERYQRLLAERERAVDGAADAYERATRKAKVAGYVMSGSLLSDWPKMDVLSKREIIRETLDNIVVVPANGKRGRGAPPVGDRVRLVWPDELKIDPDAILASEPPAIRDAGAH